MTKRAERDKWLSQDEVKALLAHVDRKADPVQRTLVHFLLHTGFRIREASNAKFEDLTLSGREPEIRTLGKGAKERVVPLSPKLVTVLRKYIAFRESVKTTKGRWGEKLNGNGLLFPYNSRHLRRIYGDAVRGAGLKRGFNSHAARHSFITAVYSKTKDLKLAADLAGHRSVATTQIYTHSTAEDRRKAVGGLYE